MSTAFHICQNGQNLVCKNQDVIYDGVYLFTNQREVHKTAMMMPPIIPASWVSTYGSLTVSQVGKENPNGGINEVGLVVEQTTLWQTKYPDTDERPAVGELQWIQYMLDTCKTVRDVLEAARAIRIDQSTSNLHYLVADRNGDRAIIEFINGEIRVHRENLSLLIMANSPYKQAIDEIQSGITDWSDCDEYEKNSMERILAVKEGIDGNLKPVNAINFAFEVLEAAKREDTVFSLVYDINRMQIHAYTSRNRERKTIHMADFDFANDSPSKAADLQLLQADQVKEHFVTYSTEFNLHAVQSFFRDPTLTSIFKWEISDEMIQFLASYPDTLN